MGIGEHQATESQSCPTKFLMSWLTLFTVLILVFLFHFLWGLTMLANIFTIHPPPQTFPLEFSYDKMTTEFCQSCFCDVAVGGVRPFLQMMTRNTFFVVVTCFVMHDICLLR